NPSHSANTDSCGPSGNTGRGLYQDPGCSSLYGFIQGLDRHVFKIFAFHGRHSTCNTPPLLYTITGHDDFIEVAHLFAEGNWRWQVVDWILDPLITEHRKSQSGTYSHIL